jgi:hypothetical protein
MTGLTELSTPVDEKGVVRHQENSDSEQRHSHQEMAGSGSEEGLHESEMDVPVRDCCAIYGAMY